MKGPDGNWIGYGLGDVDPKVTEMKAHLRRMFAAYAGHLDDTPLYDQAMVDAVKEMQSRYGLPVTGVMDYTSQLRSKFIKPVVAKPRFPIQGVGHNSQAFLMGDPLHSYVQATNEAAAEALRLYSLNPAPIVALGYSMGGDSVRKFLERLPAEHHPNVKAVVTFGDPAMPDKGSLLGDMPGRGIAGAAQPEWCWDRYWSFAIDGDWYPQARGLLFILYEVLTRAALTIEFAAWLVTQFPQRLMQELLGVAPSDDPLAGVLAPMAAKLGPAPDLTRMLRILPDLIHLLFDAVKFVATNAHGKYADPAEANWDGMTAVDKAAQIIRDRVPEATLYLFPGTWAMWNQGFQFDTAVRLQ